MKSDWKRSLPLPALALSLAAMTVFSHAEAKKISMAEAQKAALAVENGEIKSQELEKEKGRRIYSFDIVMPDGLHEVNVDALTGKVVENTIENAADEAKEAAADAKAKKAKKASETKPQ